MKQYRSLVNGAWRDGPERLEVRSPFSGKEVSSVPLSGEADVEAALASAAAAFPVTRRLATYERVSALARLRDGLQARREEFARSIAEEAGKPLTDARVEVDRGVSVLTLSAEEAKRLGGEVMPLDLAPSSANRFGITRRFPVGPVAAISPYNFPLNLGLHKVGPAIAAGAPVVWKPSLLAPGAAHLFAELVMECGLPPGAVNVITPPDTLAERLVTDDRIRMLSFTGSARVGWSLRAKAGTKKVALELGGNAAAIVCADADLDHATRRCAVGAFAYAGQVCISVQRVLVERAVHDRFVEALVRLAREVTVGDPLDENTRMGPMISEKEAARVESWLREAVDGGARILTGGTRSGLLWEPTVVADAKPHMEVSCQELFGPAVLVEPFDDFEEALASINGSRYGLQAGLFTRDFPRILRAFDTLEVGGLIVDDVPTFRVDSMPYGGVKESGLGREGVRFAIEEMTEIRLLVVNADH